MLSKNIQRRHLIATHKAVVTLGPREELEREARERMLTGTIPDPMAPVPQGASRDHAAKLAGVSPRTVQQVWTVADKAWVEDIASLIPTQEE